ncbi:MAG: HAD hydrolase family protein [Clostridiales bacterium]|nr:acylneuraminate cytidylyltransferase [Roseburia sp.]MDD7636657.1 HAD hydrolase family protein [Clostridiales bacterium]MDY4114254.1 HAD hydrolase family protein [Roseburia sp.]
MNVAFIPVRGGSKSIPLKNIKPMCGKPLVYWTVAAACNCDKIDRVYVATDSEKIREALLEIKRTENDAVFQKLEVIGRSAESASDTASTESAMLEFAANYDFDHIVLVQATSPLLTEGDLDRGFALFEEADTDSVLSVVRQKRFNWAVEADGTARALNYDYFHRPRRQDFDGYCVENGAFYITSKKCLLETGNRISGRVKAVEMSEDTFFEIDEPSDWQMIEKMLERRLRTEKPNKLSGERQSIKMFLTDCDGCLTDGGMYYSENGDELKKFSTLDGLGFRLMRDKGILCGIITGENTTLVARRAQKLKLDILKMGVTDKLSVVQEICMQYGITMQEVAYVGDDVNDKELLKAVGFSASVPGAMEEVKEIVDYVTKRSGGNGAVREVIEYILGKSEKQE